MAFWSGWSDGKKWLMGILSALIVAAIIGGFSRAQREREYSLQSGNGQTKASVAPGSEGQTTDHPPGRVQSETSGSPGGVTEQTPKPQPPPPESVHETPTEPSPPPGGSGSTTEEPYPQSDTQKGATIDLPKCRLESARLHCDSYITLTDNGWISVLYHTSVVDPQGVEVKLTKARLGTEEGKDRVKAKLSARTRTKLDLEFDGVSADLIKIEALKVETTRGDFVFHKIRISG